MLRTTDARANSKWCPHSLARSRAGQTWLQWLFPVSACAHALIPRGVNSWINSVRCMWSWVCVVLYVRTMQVQLKQYILRPLKNFYILSLGFWNETLDSKQGNNLTISSILNLNASVDAMSSDCHHLWAEVEFRYPLCSGQIVSLDSILNFVGKAFISNSL